MNGEGGDNRDKESEKDKHSEGDGLAGVGRVV